MQFPSHPPEGITRSCHQEPAGRDRAAGPASGCRSGGQRAAPPFDIAKSCRYLYKSVDIQVENLFDFKVPEEMPATGGRKNIDTPAGNRLDPPQVVSLFVSDMGDPVREAGTTDIKNLAGIKFANCQQALLQPVSSQMPPFRRSLKPIQVLDIATWRQFFVRREGLYRQKHFFLHRHFSSEFRMAVDVFGQLASSCISRYCSSQEI